MMPFLFMDYYYIVYVLPALLLALYAQSKVSSTFRKYSSVSTKSGMTGAQTAEMILQRSGIRDVGVEHIRGSLTDHYDPRTKTLRLSDSVYGSSSISAVGVAAHEAGHAIQHDEGYTPLALRSAIVPVMSFSSKLAMPLIIMGLLFSTGGTLIQIGIILFSVSVAFQLITLPVEFNASKRALNMTEDARILTDSELGGAKKVLSAAALTYVASAAVAIGQLLRLLAIFGGRNRSRR